MPARPHGPPRAPGAEDAALSSAFDTPTVPPSRPGGLSTTLRRNIAALEERRARESASQTREERIAGAITAFTGSMRFVYLHLALYGGWILANLGAVPGVPRFDASFVVLAMVASVEAIFLSTFVLISQNRTAAVAVRRAQLDLQINLLAEHEVSRLAEMVAAIAGRLGIGADPEIAEISKDVAPEAVLDALEARQGPAA